MVGRIRRIGRAKDQEVAWEVDALDGQARAAGHLDESNGERNRDACAARKDVVEEAVARVFVVLPVADEPELPEKEFRHHP